MFQRLLVEKRRKEKVNGLQFEKQYSLYLCLINIPIASLEEKENEILVKLALTSSV